MGVPQLYVWVVSPDGKLDVMRYTKATKRDILRQPAVVAEHDALKARVAELEGAIREHRTEVKKRSGSRQAGEGSYGYSWEQKMWDALGKEG